MLVYFEYISSVLGILVLILHERSYAQLEEKTSNDPDVSVIFLGFIVAVIALGLYIARDAILRKKTDYDSREYNSKKDRTDEKYKSDWQDDYVKPNTLKKPIINHYDTLGISHTATDAEIKMHYRKLAKKHHPDRTGTESEELVHINKAYEVLSDAELRYEYDKTLS